MNLQEAQEYLARIFANVESQTVAQVKNINVSCTAFPAGGPEYFQPTYTVTVEFETAQPLVNL